MKVSVVALTLLLACSALANSGYSGIWPQQLAYTPGSHTGWNELQNDVYATTGADVYFWADPILVPSSSQSTYYQQDQQWAFYVYGAGVVPALDIVHENVTVYLNIGGSWQYSNSGETDSNGAYTSTINNIPPLATIYPILNLLTANNHFGRSAIYNLIDGTQTIVFTIDGTLTTSNYTTYCTSVTNCNPTLRADAVNVAQFWYNKNYFIVYLAARPASLYETTTNYLINNNFPPGLVQLAPNLDTALNNAQSFEYNFLVDLQNAGASIDYGYASTTYDINAMLQAGLTSSSIYVVGSNGGDSGTVALGNDFTNHYNSLTNNLLILPAIIPGPVIYGNTGTVTNETSPASVVSPLFGLIALLALFFF